MLFLMFPIIAGRFIRGVLLFFGFLSATNCIPLRGTLPPVGAKEHMKQLHARNAAMLREHMVKMGGVLIKIGQFSSALARGQSLPRMGVYAANFQKPPEDQVTPQNISDIMKRVVEELGPPEEIFSSFAEDPLPRASLGQVHRAR